MSPYLHLMTTRTPPRNSYWKGDTLVTPPNNPLSPSSPLCVRISSTALSLCQPKGLDLAALVTKSSLDHRWGTRKREHKLAYIVHYVVEQGHRDSRSFERGSFVPVHFRTLRKMIQGDDTKPALDALVAMGVLEASPYKYSVGRFSRGYRLTPAYRERPIEWRIVENATLARAVHRLRIEQNATAVADCPIRAAVLEHLSSLTWSQNARHLVEARTYQSVAERAAWALTISDIDNSQRWIAADEKTGRIFHNVTQCPGDLRPHLLLDGEPVAEVDVCSAQPFILLSFYDEANGPADEKQRYADLVGDWTFYETIYDGCRDRGPWGGSDHSTAWYREGADPTNRPRFKQHFLRQVLYSSTAKWQRTPQVFESFRRLFPWLADQLVLLRASREGGRYLALKMQAKEAELILGRVFPRVLAELPGCKAISIHDGILCQARFGRTLERLVKEEARKMFGAEPRVRVKALQYAEASKAA